MSHTEETLETLTQPLASSEHRLRWLCGLIAVLALIGLADALYLTVEHLSGRSVRCTVTTGCSQVLSSRYATLAGFPLAAFGAAAYFAAFSLATFGAFGSVWARRLLMPLVASMFLFTLWLLYLQAFVLRAFCQYCLLSAVITTLLVGLAFVLYQQERRSYLTK